MQDEYKPDFEAFTGLEISGKSRWERIATYLDGCEFAIFAIAAIAWFSKPLNFASLVATYSFIFILGIVSALIRRKSNVQTGSNNKETETEP